MKYSGNKETGNEEVVIFPHDEPSDPHVSRKSLVQLSELRNEAVQHGEVGRGITNYKPPRTSGRRPLQ